MSIRRLKGFMEGWQQHPDSRQYVKPYPFCMLGQVIRAWRSGQAKGPTKLWVGAARVGWVDFAGCLLDCRARHDVILASIDCNATYKAHLINQ